MDPDSLARELGDHAEVVLLETGDATWAVSAALPKRLDVYGGAARIWWPGLVVASDPYDHPLLVIQSEYQADRARQRLLATILEEPEEGAARPGGTLARAPPREAVQPRSEAKSDAWRLIGDHYRAGDVVRARVFRIDARYVLVELLPGAGVKVPLAEIDFTWVRHPSDLLSVGEPVIVRLLSLDPGAGRGIASIKQALLSHPRPGIPLRPGERGYLEDAEADSGRADSRLRLARAEERILRLEEELEAAVDDRQRLGQHNETMKKQLASAREELRSEQDRRRALEQTIAGEMDPLASETVFLAAVRVEHARRFDEADRLRYPLLRMRVGRAFLGRLRALEGIEVRKVVEVCAQVASDRAHEVPGRSVHELAASEAGNAITRSSDGARAWRCSLQDGTPGARRLHWWRIPGHDGPTIEFASVAVHDDYSIP